MNTALRKSWRQRRARQRELQQQQQQWQLRVWGGPVDADRVLAFSDAIFAIAITLLTLDLRLQAGLHGRAFTEGLRELLPALAAYALSFFVLAQLWLAHHRIFAAIAQVNRALLVRNLLFLGLIAVMPFPVGLLSGYHDRPFAVVVYAVAFIAAMEVQRRIWRYVTRPEQHPLLREPVSDEVRDGFNTVLVNLLLVFGAVLPVALFVPRYALFAWAAMIPIRLLLLRFQRGRRACDHMLTQAARK